MLKNRSPGMKLLIVALIGGALIIPLLFVYGLVSDRQHQAREAQDSIAAGWAGAQAVSGPVLMLPYRKDHITTEIVEGRSMRRTVRERHNLFLSPEQQSVEAQIDPQVKERAIYRSVLYRASINGSARFELPDDLTGLGIDRQDLLLDEAELRFGMSDPRGLQTDARLVVNGDAMELHPGRGPASSGGTGVHAMLDWTGGETLDLQWSYSLRGSRSFGFVPRGQSTEWTVTSSWAHPSFVGSFLPDADAAQISDEGFSASWSISNLALGQPMVSQNDFGPAQFEQSPVEVASDNGASKMATIRLVEPVDLYSLVDRSVKYGFLFIGFTFLAFLMFDIIGGAKVASAEYLLSGAGLILFFVMLLAFAEMIGFAWAYIVASGAIIGLLTSYSAAVLKSWRRASMIGGLLVGLYVMLYVLLNLEGLSLVIGSVILFFALAGVMYTTRDIDWSDGGSNDGEVTGYA